MIKKMSKPVISIENVVKSFGTAVVLDDITLDVEKGKICGIIRKKRFRKNRVI